MNLCSIKSRCTHGCSRVVRDAKKCSSLQPPTGWRVRHPPALFSGSSRTKWNNWLRWVEVWGWRSEQSELWQCRCTWASWAEHVGVWNRHSIIKGEERKAFSRDWHACGRVTVQKHQKDNLVSAPCESLFCTSEASTQVCEAQWPLTCHRLWI